MLSLLLSTILSSWMQFEVLYVLEVHLQSIADHFVFTGLKCEQRYRSLIDETLSRGLPIYIALVQYL